MKTQEEILSRLIAEHDEANNKMIHHFGDDAVRIEVDKTTGHIGVFISGSLVDAYENLTDTELENLQRKYADVWFELTNKF